MSKKHDVTAWYSHMYEAKRMLISLFDDKQKVVTYFYQESENAISPSEYKKQMLQTTEERIAHLSKPEYLQNIRSTLESSENVFQATPPILIFQNFTPGATYNVPLTIRNKTKQPRSLKQYYDLDPIVSVEFRGTSYSSLVAPGLAHIYNVKFCPEENLDYVHQAKFTTDTGSLVIPIIAIGPRPILDFPDFIEVPVTAVKLQSSKSILVRNAGNVQAVFSIHCDNACFWVEPSRGIVDKDEQVQITVHFLSKKIGDFRATGFLSYDTGETLSIDLHSSAVNCVIEMDRSNIRMEETYLGTSRSEVLTIHNRSSYIVHFEWMRYKDKEADQEKRHEYQDIYGMIYNMELARSTDLLYYNVCTLDAHELICQRIYNDEIDSLDKETFPFNHFSFILTPEKGTIGPHSSTCVTIFFRALSVPKVLSTAYLEVTGQEDRIPLSLHGAGKGPVLQLNVVTIDTKDIYLCSLHNFEIVAANVGLIKGTLIYRPRPTYFGGSITVNPTKLILKPDEYKSFNLTFTSNRQGKFVEKLDFFVKESQETIHLHVKGCIVLPSLLFDKDTLDFGVVPLGFSSCQEVNICNKSSVSVTFNITIPDDGNEPPLYHEKFAFAQTKPDFPENPREFLIKPTQDIVPSQSSLRLKFIYPSNFVGTSLDL
ncbi:hydrocephalus-inducing protein homolog [Prorops nasuta]|uniref:hydrocephalus-inducing protein homolog n=1 Tax=Prorops nasuta TaxID=863751 RepID=UPI0034CE2C80